MLIRSFIIHAVTVVGMMLMAIDCEDMSPLEYSFKNMTEESVYIYCNSSCDDGVRLTTKDVLIEDYSLYWGAWIDTVAPGKEVTVNTYKSLIRHRRDFYHIFVFRTSTFEKYTKDELIRDNIYDDYLLYEYNHLKRHNFKIEYHGKHRDK